VSLSPWGRLLFIGMWNFADDHGGIEYLPLQLKMRIFPADNVDVQKEIDSLIAHGFLTEYSVNGSKYLNINNFRKHQKVNRPGPNRVPPIESRDNSVSDHGGLTVGSGIGSGIGENHPPKKKRPKIDYSDDFKKFWAVYPRPIFKTASFTAWKSAINIDGAAPNKIIRSAKEYASQCEVEHREEKHIMHPETFLHKERWQEYCYKEAPHDHT